jgi:hypothetical protein
VADSQSLDLFFPAAVLFGLSGPSVTFALMSMASLFPAREGMLLSAINCAFDASVVVLLVLRALIEADLGWHRRGVFLVYSLVGIAFAIFAGVFWPKKGPDADAAALVEVEEDDSSSSSPSSSVTLDLSRGAVSEEDAPSFLSESATLLFVTFVAFASLTVLFMNTYIGTLVPQLFQRFETGTAEDLAVTFNAILPGGFLVTYLPNLSQKRFARACLTCVSV